MIVRSIIICVCAVSDCRFDVLGEIYYSAANAAGAIGFLACGFC